MPEVMPEMIIQPTQSKTQRERSAYQPDDLGSARFRQGTQRKKYTKSMFYPYYEPQLVGFQFAASA